MIQDILVLGVLLIWMGEMGFSSLQMGQILAYFLARGSIFFKISKKCYIILIAFIIINEIHASGVIIFLQIGYAILNYPVT